MRGATVGLLVWTNHRPLQDQFVPVNGPLSLAVKSAFPEQPVNKLA
jgi:hypothetical protein